MHYFTFWFCFFTVISFLFQAILADAFANKDRDKAIATATRVLQVI